MTKFIIRRLISIIPTMFIIITLSFFLIRFAPGGPFSSERNVPEQVLQNLLKKYHMDEPLMQQYFRFCGDILRWDFGPSFRYKESTVNELIDQTSWRKAEAGDSELEEAASGAADEAAGDSTADGGSAEPEVTGEAAGSAVREEDVAEDEGAAEDDDSAAGRLEQHPDDERS